MPNIIFVNLSRIVYFILLASARQVVVNAFLNIQNVLNYRFAGWKMPCALTVEGEGADAVRCEAYKVEVGVNVSLKRRRAYKAWFDISANCFVAELRRVHKKLTTVAVLLEPLDVASLDRVDAVASNILWFYNRIEGDIARDHGLVPCVDSFDVR